MTISQVLSVPDWAVEPQEQPVESASPAGPRGMHESRSIRIPIAGSELVLEVPAEISESTLNREIAGQDVVRQQLLHAVDRLDRVAGNNRELLFCSRGKVRAITREFLSICHELRRFIGNLSKYRSAIPELQDARENVQLFFTNYAGGEIEEIELLEQALFTNVIHADDEEPRDLGPFRRKLAKCTGRIRTELQKVFAHLFACDPRNLYRHEGPRTEKEILFRQFHHDVELTADLYKAVLKLDTYMRGAIIPSDVIKMISDKIDKEKTVACLFESDYYFFLDALIDEVLDILLPEIRSVLNLDGIWYDDFENIDNKARMLAQACLEFRMLYAERSGLREEIQKAAGEDGAEGLEHALAVCDTYRYHDVSRRIREIDQILVDLEGTFLQWQMGITRRAFALEAWRRQQPLERRPAK